MAFTGPCMAIVPARDFRGGKSRLAPALDEDLRAELSRWMLTRVLKALKNAHNIHRIAVVSEGAETLSLGESMGVEKISCPARDMNGDLELGRAWANENGARWLLVVHGDLPALETSEVESMIGHAIEGPNGCAVVSPSMDGGTNGLLLGPPESLPFAFGEGSFQRHMDLAQKRNLRAIPFDSPGFRLDVDTISDVSAIIEMGVPAPEWLSALSLP